MDFDTDKVKAMIDNMIRNEHFCDVVTDNLAKDDLPEGSRVFVVGNQLIPYDENDIYNQRVNYIVAKLDGDHVKDTQYFLVDPINIKPVAADEQERLMEILKVDFPPAEPQVANETAH